MRKILNYILVVSLLLVVLFSLTGCGSKENVETVTDDVILESDDVIENIEDNNEENVVAEEVSFDGVYVGKEEDNMEGLVIIADGPDKLVFIKDVQGGGCTRVGGENVVGNYMEEDLMNETFRITDEGENVKFTHPIFTFGSEAIMTPSKDEFCGIYKNEHNYLAIFKNFNGEMTVAYMETKFDNSVNATMKEFTVKDNAIEGKDDVYDEPITMTFDGDKLTFNIVSEDSRWNRANIEYTKMK